MLTTKSIQALEEEFLQEKGTFSPKIDLHEGVFCPRLPDGRYSPESNAPAVSRGVSSPSGVNPTTLKQLNLFTDEI